MILIGTTAINSTRKSYGYTDTVCVQNDYLRDGILADSQGGRDVKGKLDKRVAAFMEPHHLKSILDGVS